VASWPLGAGDARPESEREESNVRYSFLKATLTAAAMARKITLNRRSIGLIIVVFCSGLITQAHAAPVTHHITFVQTGPVVSGAIYVGSFDVDSASLMPSATIPVSNFMVAIEGNSWIQGTDQFFVAVANTDASSTVTTLSLGALDNVSPAGTNESLSIDPFTWAVRDPTSGESINEGTYSISSTPPTLGVAIDIKPGSFPNSINIGSAGVIPVAILGSATFDATQVDPETVALAGASVKLIGKGDKYSCNAGDVNADGFVDLVCHVYTAQFMIEPGDSVAVLEAKTFGGQAIRGEDSINVVPN